MGNCKKNRTLTSSPIFKGMTLALFLVGASAHASRVNPNFVMASKAKPGVVAEYRGETIAEGVLLQRSNSLEHLLTKHKELKAVLAYRMAGEKMVKEGQESATLKFFSDISEKGFEATRDRHLVNQVAGLTVEFAAADPEKPLAELDEQAWPPAGTQFTHFGLYSLENKMFAEKVRVIEGMFAKKVIRDAATAKQMGDDEFVKNELGGLGNEGGTAVNDFVVSQWQQEPYTLYLQRPQLNIEVKKDLAVVSGHKIAPVKVHLFSNYKCTECDQVSKFVKDLRSQGKYDVKLFYHPVFPPRQTDLLMMAEAAICVKKQLGDAGFWQFYDRVSNIETVPDEGTMRDIATELKVDTEKYRDCYFQREARDEVESQIKYAEYIGIRRGPVAIVEGELVRPELGITAADEVLQSHVAQLGFVHKVKRYFYRLFE